LFLFRQGKIKENEIYKMIAQRWFERFDKLAEEQVLILEK
jgi:hypothetical protein